MLLKNAEKSTIGFSPSQVDGKFETFALQNRVRIGLCLFIMIFIKFMLCSCSSGAVQTSVPTFREQDAAAFPYTFVIDEEFFDGSRLILFAVVEASGPLNLSELALSLQLLEEDQVIAERVEPVSVFLADDPEPEQSVVRIVADISAPDGTQPTSYQAELRWGRRVSSLASGVELEVGALIRDCDACDHPWSLPLSFLNNGDSPVQGLSFLLKLEHPDQSVQDEIFLDGTEVALPELYMEVGESREFVVDLEYYQELLRNVEVAPEVTILEVNRVEVHRVGQN